MTKPPMTEAMRRRLLLSDDDRRWRPNATLRCWPQKPPLAPPLSVEDRMPDRVDFVNGRLDEVVSTKGAHLEHLGDGRWFLSFQHEDGTSSAFWFKSKDLRSPTLFWEKRHAT